MHAHYRLTLLMAALALLLAALEASPFGRRVRLERAVRGVLATAAAGSLLFVAVLWFRHARFPFNLDLMEFGILQHVLRALHHQPIYPAASPDFVPFAYNPLFYYAVLPLVLILGPGLFPLRLFSILGTLGATLTIFVAVAGRTRSRWWGLVTAGLFAGAYRAMDAYLDTAHSDSWLVFAALLGTWLIDRNRSRWSNRAGLLLLVAAFWFKQHGAFFALGGALYLARRDGLRRSWPDWVALLLIGPVLYVAAGPALFGPGFHFYTWDVPRHWSRLDAATFLRLAGFFGRYYAILLLAALWLFVQRARTPRRDPGAWEFQLPFAALTAFMGALDADSSNNVFIPLGTWLIVVGALGLHDLSTRALPVRFARLGHLGLLLAFAALAYDPREVATSSRAGAKYAEMVAMLDSLPGRVYAPWIGQLPRDYRFDPAAHWVALDDLERAHLCGPRDVAVLLAPAIHPGAPAFVLANRRIETFTCLRALTPCYVLDTDLGDRFAALRVLPKRWDHGWPRFLYRYDPAAATAGGPPGLDFRGHAPHPAAP